ALAAVSPAGALRARRGSPAALAERLGPAALPRLQDRQARDLGAGLRPAPARAVVGGEPSARRWSYFSTVGYPAQRVPALTRPRPGASGRSWRRGLELLAERQIQGVGRGPTPCIEIHA